MYVYMVAIVTTMILNSSFTVAYYGNNTYMFY